MLILLRKQQSTMTNDSFVKKVPKSAYQARQEKFQLRTIKLFHMGVILIAEGIKPSPWKPDCIQAMLAPTNTDKIRRVHGVQT